MSTHRDERIQKIAHSKTCEEAFSVLRDDLDSTQTAKKGNTMPTTTTDMLTIYVSREDAQAIVQFLDTSGRSSEFMADDDALTDWLQEWVHYAGLAMNEEDRTAVTYTRDEENTE